MLNKIRWSITYWVLNQLQENAWEDWADHPFLVSMMLISTWLS